MRMTMIVVMMMKTMMIVVMMMKTMMMMMRIEMNQDGKNSRDYGNI
jgi:hypothetical protein